MRLFYGAKGVAFFMANPLFHVKLGSVVVVLICFFWVAVQHTKVWRKPSINQPPGKAITWVLNIELVIVAAIPLLAAMASRGVGLG